MSANRIVGDDSLIGQLISPKLAGDAVKSTVQSVKSNLTPGKEGAGAIETPAAPPTPEDAAASLLKGEGLGPKTYGRKGTIKNIGGRKGLAASTLNLSSQTLTGV